MDQKLNLQRWLKILISKTLSVHSVTTWKIHLCTRYPAHLSRPSRLARQTWGDVFNVKHSGGRERDTRTYWFETCFSIDEKACGKWVQSSTQKTPGCSLSPPSSFNKSPPYSSSSSLWPRCIVGEVVAIRPLRGLRGRRQNPEIHYAFKTPIYFRITYILSPGGRSAGKRLISCGIINIKELRSEFCFVEKV